MKLEDFRETLKELRIKEMEEQALRLLVKAYLMEGLSAQALYRSLLVHR